LEANPVPSSFCKNEEENNPEYLKWKKLIKAQVIQDFTPSDYFEDWDD